MPVNRVGWGGLTSWEGIETSPGAQVRKLEAVKRFGKAIRERSRTKGEDLEKLLPASLQAPEPSLITQSSSGPSAAAGEGKKGIEYV